MSFDDCEQEYDEFFDQPDEFDMESIEWHRNIFSFINSSNVLYIPDQLYMV